MLLHPDELDATRHVARHRRSKRHPSHGVVVSLGVVVGLVVGGALIAAAAVPLPSGPPQLSLDVTSTRVLGVDPTVPFPSQGQSAVAVPTFGFEASTADQSPVPIASLTKMMTAYVTLRDLPLSGVETGPSIVVSAADVATYHSMIRQNASVVKVVVGEVLLSASCSRGCSCTRQATTRCSSPRWSRGPRT